MRHLIIVLYEWTTGAGMRALQLTGSTTLLPRMQRAAETWMDTQVGRVVINGGCGTARGYKALLDGTTDIAMASGAVPADLADAATARGLTFRDTIVARDAILPLVHPSNPLATLTLLQLRNIFTGRIVNWRSLGGPNAAIAVLVGPPSGGVTSSWRRALLGDDDTFTPLAQVLGTDERLARIAAQALAITYVPHMAIAGDRQKVLRVDGMTEAAPAYPLWAPMTLVTLGAPSIAAARFIAAAAGEVAA
jgi:phosphate transport system substrate-binding protein